MAFIDKWRMDFCLMTLRLALRLKGWSFVNFNRALKSYQVINGLHVTLDIDDIVDKEIKRRVEQKYLIAGLKEDYTESQPRTFFEVKKLAWPLRKHFDSYVKNDKNLTAFDKKIRLSYSSELTKYLNDLCE